MSDGSVRRLAYILESPYGTTPSNPVFKIVRLTGGGPTLAKDVFESEEIRADRMKAAVRHGIKKISGDFGIELSYTSFDDFLEALLGGTWDDDVLKAGITRRSFTFENYFADQDSGDNPYHRYTGCEITKLSLTIPANGMVKGSFGIIGQDVSVNAAIVSGATYGDAETTQPFDSYTGTISGDGSGVATEVQMTIENAMELRPIIGDNKTLEPSQQTMKITGTVTVWFANATMYSKFIDETPSALDITLVDLDGNSLQIQLPALKYTGGSPDVKGSGSITIALPFEAYYDGTAESNIVITRTDAVA